ncbi:MAG: cysteine--tRNA ligase [Gammaproteobacteria bacterium]|nr:cysteine--tRNA ligase [Gammaproteobacteria bacterium]MXW45895.1 cysteine--tRNA ligase [Gammaproteobacteria bacterium]MYD00763.1 cysteine--tRNA ligase [Gammaproteobacteria bacterium]MYI25449.1 cysteine--tRNA ligase [Gammaproteobacteria bacterium]
MISLYNTLGGERQPFVPGDGDRVTMYVCGPTVYGPAHIGNARPAVVFDVLARLLRRRYNLVYASNITDVDDKINQAAAEKGVPIARVAQRWIRTWREDIAGLGVLAPDRQPLATEHVPQMIGLVKSLLKSGHAYEAEGHVLFRVGAYAAYGELSGRNRDEQIAGARVEVAPYKEDPADFVLWKPSSEELPGWESPWGRGRPGWHLECSAMAREHLGETIDIHGGGRDLIFPHHENEIAQSRCAHGAPLARYWMHNGMIRMGKSKMAKSRGNILTIRELRGKVPGEVLRLALLSARYRDPLEWSDELVAASRQRLDRLYRVLLDCATETREEGHSRAAEPSAELVQALEDDLNTPAALSVLAAEVRKLRAGAVEPVVGAAALKAGGFLLGILQTDPAEWFTVAESEPELTAEEIETRIAERARERAAGDYAAADRIRDELAGRGVILEDGPQGTTWRRTAL